jgi:hypothetical protein
MEGQLGDVHAFLEDNRGFYDIGFVSSFGLDGVQVQETSRQHNGNRQWELSGAWGAAADCLMIITFDRRLNQWKFLLNESANATEQLDLDNDGQEEIVTRFGAAVDVTIYRWRLDHFESADIAKAVGCDYARLFQANGKWLFEAVKLVKLVNRHLGDARFYRYVKGRLARVDVIPEEKDRQYF